ncbi:hypothetical protein PG997_013250 [Apiospora hydei]|uniref:Uncharacterized protein n=1 Tax=Apiospora hydei TaxID=1337664 RepID=A0ABR1V5Q1_9PEZI
MHLRLRPHRTDSKKKHSFETEVPGKNVNLGEMDKILKQEFGRRKDYRVVVSHPPIHHCVLETTSDLGIASYRFEMTDAWYTPRDL